MPSLRRLPGYHHFLKQLTELKEEYVSATTIAQELKLIPIQVRKDLAYTGIIGKPKVGYPVKELIIAIEEFLDWNNTKKAFLVGVGDLGRAIIKYQGFHKLGVEIIAAFDSSPEIIGSTIGGIKILHVDKLTTLAKRINVKIGIITVPEDAAQSIADKMIVGGIKGLWNFAPVKLKIPRDIVVQSVNLAASLSVLCKQLSDVIKK
ncbi:MAG: redox-sensing transcriptional repressor Rex [Spirochaetales bacterium]|nr:redox-sensing transcriptional repressor Rex [Spirochaetales bacterium]